MTEVACETLLVKRPLSFRIAAFRECWRNGGPPQLQIAKRCWRGLPSRHCTRQHQNRYGQPVRQGALSMRRRITNLRCNVSYKTSVKTTVFIVASADDRRALLPRACCTPQLIKSKLQAAMPINGAYIPPNDIDQMDRKPLHSIPIYTYQFKRAARPFPTVFASTGSVSWTPPFREKSPTVSPSLPFVSHADEAGSAAVPYRAIASSIADLAWTSGSLCGSGTCLRATQAGWL